MERSLLLPEGETGTAVSETAGLEEEQEVVVENIGNNEDTQDTESEKETVPANMGRSTNEDTTTGKTSTWSWSDWSTSIPASGSEYETKEQYRYRTRETTSSNSSSLSGWTQYDESSTWGDYGSWSDWSTSAVSESDSTQVRTKTQYRYQYYQTTSETSYGSWSAWQDTAITSSSTLDVETQTVKTGTQYYLAHYCTGSGAGTHSLFTSYTNQTDDSTFNAKCSYHELGWVDASSLSTSSGNGNYWVWETGYRQAYKYGSKLCSNGCYLWYIKDTKDVTKTQYRSRQITTTKKQYKSDTWSDWSDTSSSASNIANTNTRILYSYRTRQRQKTYYFERWSDWSSYSDTAVSSTVDREIQTRTVYRYKIYG
jgi:hypothetical protein